ncbi:hypothetical protein BD410DRAFT_785089 [Rickenella mellea]|uniref:Uncharacterized protein n=1 Tax=Rickenella mellea TaxID=50990 RepID=A0A4Y7QDB8_9AGAM|nr:hypothetical protein BD410DRAFT_785089 [Rickenella mellea]
MKTLRPQVPGRRRSGRAHIRCIIMIGVRQGTAGHPLRAANTPLPPPPPLPVDHPIQRHHHATRTKR